MKRIIARCLCLGLLLALASCAAPARDDPDKDGGIGGTGVQAE